MTEKRSIGGLVFWAFVWTIIIWFVGLVLVGGYAGAMNPANGGQAGERMGREMSGPVFLFAIVVSTFLTIGGVLPGTRKRSDILAGQPVPVPGFDYAGLERLADLRDRGLLTDDEFAAQKAKLLNG